MPGGILRSIATWSSIWLAAGSMACRVESTPTAPTARSTAPAIEITTDGGITMVLIPSGTFSMGSDMGEADERPPHEVTLAAYAIDKFEVTQDQFSALELPDPSHFKDPKRPVEQVRWSDAADFCNMRSLEEGLEPCYDELNYECNFDANGYRLPTEAEWERAARAATTADHPVEGAKETIGGFACYAGNSRKKTALVGKKKPNDWGIHDMQGNVLEWCNDFYGADYYKASPPRDPRGAADGKKRVLRGGSWNAGAGACRVSARFADAPGLTDACFARDTYGFRCVRKLTAQEEARVTTE